MTRWPAWTAEVTNALSSTLGARTAWGEGPCLYTIRPSGGRCLLDPTAVPPSWWERGPLPEVLARITQAAADLVAVPGIQRRADSYGIAVRFEGHCVPRDPLERARFGEAEAAAAARAPGRGLAAARYLIGVDRAGVTYLSRQQEGWRTIRSTVIAYPEQDGPVTAAVRRLTEVVSGIAVPAGERSAEPGR